MTSQSAGLAAAPELGLLAGEAGRLRPREKQCLKGRADPTGPRAGDWQQNLTSGQRVLLERGLSGTSACLIFIKIKKGKNIPFARGMHPHEQSASGLGRKPCSLSPPPSVSLQILLAGGPGGYEASRACSPTTT